MVSRVAAFVIWAAVAASIIFWGMRLWAKPIPAPAHAVVVSTASGFNGDLGRVLGVDAPAAPVAVPTAPQATADPRYRLIGVVAPRSAAANGEGVALIATEGKPPKAYRVGAAVDGEMVLLAVHSRGASLGPRGQPAQVALELPALPPPSTGTLGAPASASPALRAPTGLLPRPQLAQPLPGTPGQAPAPDADEAEPPSDPASRPGVAPPAGIVRPPTLERRAPA
jgi:general secretion pathway protein C